MKDEILRKRFGVPQERLNALREHNKERKDIDEDSKFCHTLPDKAKEKSISEEYPPIRFPKNR